MSPLSENYHKARRQYALFSGLLIAWEFVGLRLHHDSLRSKGIDILSPQAVPFALIALILYFFYRIVMEWLRNDESTRERALSMTDFAVSHFLALGAIGVFIYQRMAAIQIADNIRLWVGQVNVGDVFAGIFGVLVVSIVSMSYMSFKRRGGVVLDNFLVGLSLATIITFVFSFVINGIDTGWAISVAFGGILAATVTMVYLVLGKLRKWMKRKRPSLYLADNEKVHAIRMEYYDRVLAYINNVRANGRADYQSAMELLRQTKHADVYFGEDIVDFLNELYQYSIEFEKVNRQWSQLTVSSPEDVAAPIKNKWMQITGWFDKSHDEAKKRFAPYVKLVD